MSSIFYTYDTDDDISGINSDELMLKELERRDGIYSFIFHELEATPIPSTPSPPSTPSVVSALSAPSTPATPATPATSTTSATSIAYIYIDEDDNETYVNNCSSFNEPVALYIREPIIETESSVEENDVISIADEMCMADEELHIESTTSFSPVIPISSTLTLSTTATTPLTVISITSPKSSPTLSVTSSPSPNDLTKLSQNHNNDVFNNKSSKKSGRRLMKTKLSNEHSAIFMPTFTTTTPGSLLFNHSNIYDCMAPEKFRVRIPLPRFSHIITPLMRNRKHVLKESPEYKNAMLCNNNVAPDLRHLFPHDPDVHAPFIKSSKKNTSMNK